MKPLLRSSFFAILILVFAVKASTQSIWNKPITGTNPNTSNPYIIGNVKNANIAVTGIGLGTGITGSNANDRYDATGWNLSALHWDDYFSFTLTPTSGYKTEFVRFIYTGQIDGT